MVLFHGKLISLVAYTRNIIHIHIIESGKFNQRINRNTGFAIFVVCISPLTDI